MRRPRPAAETREHGWLVLGAVCTGLAALALADRELTLPSPFTSVRLALPAVLGLLGFVPWLLAARAGQRGRIAAALRSACWACLVLALSQPEVERTSARVGLVVATDVSASVDDAALADARTQIASLRSTVRRGSPQAGALAAQRDADSLQIVRFAKHARVVAAADATLPRQPADDDSSATDLQSALELSYGLFEADHVRNLLLITDGNETRGDVLREAERAARLGVRIDFLALPAPTTPDLAVRDLRLPSDLAVGVPFTLRATLSSERPTRATARVFAVVPHDKPRLEATREVELRVGLNDFELPVTAATAGRIEYRLELQPSAADRWPDNNAANVAGDVPGPPRVLVIDSEPSLAAPLARALETRELAVDVRPPSAAPRRGPDLAGYAFVILSDVSARELRPDTVAALRNYVEALGGGLLVSAGAQGYGLGAYQGSGLEQLIPVRAIAEEQRDQASLALALIIDCSGSMAGGKLELAREAAALTAQTLADPDLIEVIGFSSQPERRVRLQPASNRASIAQSIARLAATGGTQLYPALDAAYRDLRGAQARLKHAILLTDGQTQEAGIEDLASSMRADGITLSTVGLGTEVNRGLLETIAGLGGGRAYFPLDARNVPQIFMSEASRHKRPSAVDRSTRILERERAGFLDGIPLSSAPTLAGYVTTQAKPRPTQVILETDRGEPLLARWRFGLGYVLAWTSDLKPRWASSLLRWPTFARMLAQLVREHMRSPALQRIPLEASVERERLRVTGDALSGDDQFENGLDARIRIFAAEGEVAAAHLVQTAPARYEASLPWNRVGAFTIAGSFERHGLPQAVGQGSFATTYSAELESARPNLALLTRVAERTGGQQLRTAAAALDPGKRRVRFREACWPALAWLALGLFLVEQCVRQARLLGRTPPPNSPGK
jgi:Ca-activated chloride channel family protein